MLAKLFKKETADRDRLHPALVRLNQLGVRSDLCTLTRTRDGKEVQEEVGPISFFCREDDLFTRGNALYLVPPSGSSLEELPFTGRGELVKLQFFHARAPHSLDCEVVQRVRFSPRLLERVEPRVPIGYKLIPKGGVSKNDSRHSLRFAHIRGVSGPQVFPHFRFSLFVEKVQMNGLAHEQPPDVIPYPGDTSMPEELKDFKDPSDLVNFFHTTLRTNPEHLQEVHVTRIVRDQRLGITEPIDLGYTPALGLKGDSKGTQIHIRNPHFNLSKSKKEKAPDRLREGDAVLIRFVGRGLLHGTDVHYSWACRVYKCGLETLTLRPKGPIQKQTGLPVVVRDFSVSGVGLQNSPILETYLLGDEEIPSDPEDLLKTLVGTNLLLHFYPRLYYPNDVAAYRPQIPAAFSLLGEIARGRIDTGKDSGRIATLGIGFRHDPVDFDPQSYEPTAWEPLRGLRENRHFKEIHRALNSLLAYLDH